MNAIKPKSEFIEANGIRLHYLDWGGDGPALLFLAGMGCTAYIFTHFAPRFSDKFHVLALTRRGHGDSDAPATGYDVDTLVEDVRQFLDVLGIEQVILAGHSFAGVELSRFSALYPKRLIKLVYLEAAFDRSSPAFKAMQEANPLRHIRPPGLKDEYDSLEEYVAGLKTAYPGLKAIWGEVMNEEVRHTLKVNPQGKWVDRMPQAIGDALSQTMVGYTPEDARICVPVLSIYALQDGADYISDNFMTAEQIAEVRHFFDTDRMAYQRESIARFRRLVPQARIVEIPRGHHYCFIKQGEIVFEEMRRFLLS
jgi:pimeloyl-ACP methyl ester carboxylesterase